MVLNIFDERPYVRAIVLLQDVNAKFPTPKEKNPIFKVTKVSFADGNVFKNWLLDKDYSYKIVHVSREKIKVAIFNMTKMDEMQLAIIGAKINSINGILGYYIDELGYKLEKVHNTA